MKEEKTKKYTLETCLGPMSIMLWFGKTWLSAFKNLDVMRGKQGKENAIFMFYYLNH